jgi:hypothetical protein
VYYGEPDAADDPLVATAADDDDDPMRADAPAQHKRFASLRKRHRPSIVAPPPLPLLTPVPLVATLWRHQLPPSPLDADICIPPTPRSSDDDETVPPTPQHHYLDSQQQHQQHQQQHQHHTSVAAASSSPAAAAFTTAAACSVRRSIDGWTAAHDAAASASASRIDALMSLEFDFEVHMRTSCASDDVPPASTVLHVAVARRRLAVLQCILAKWRIDYSATSPESSSLHRMIKLANGDGETARGMLATRIDDDERGEYEDAFALADRRIENARRSQFSLPSHITRGSATPAHARRRLK